MIEIIAIIAAVFGFVHDAMRTMISEMSLAGRRAEAGIRAASHVSRSALTRMFACVETMKLAANGRACLSTMKSAVSQRRLRMPGSWAGGKFMSLKRASLLMTLAGGLAAGQSVWADDTADAIKALKEQIEELDQKVRILERRRELDQEEAEQKAKTTPVLSVGERGFSMQSADGAFNLRLRALVQADGRFYFDHGGNNEGFLIRRARLEFTGTLFQQFDFRVMPDFAGTTPTLLDAWLDWRISPGFQVLAGKTKLPVGLERFQSREYNLMTEFGYPTSLVPNRDIGVAIHGATPEGGLDYYLGAFNGTTDGGSSVTNPDDDEVLAARLFASPFRHDGPAGLQGFGLGIGGTYGNGGGTPSNYSTVGQQTFYRWLSGVVIDGTTWRLDPQVYYFYGPFGLLGEYATSSQRVRNGSAFGTVRNRAWQVTASYVLTGEAATFGGVKPKKPADFARGQWGAWQLVARVTELDIDNDAFPVFANPAASASRARSYGGGLSWYVNSLVRVSADYNFTEFQGAPLGNEHVLITRVQFRF
jgi:phosphate-selective porin OprO and OprP